MVKPTRSGEHKEDWARMRVPVWIYTHLYPGWYVARILHQTTVLQYIDVYKCHSFVTGKGWLGNLIFSPLRPMSMPTHVRVKVTGNALLSRTAILFLAFLCYSVRRIARVVKDMEFPKSLYGYRGQVFQYNQQELSSSRVPTPALGAGVDVLTMFSGRMVQSDSFEPRSCKEDVQERSAL